MAAWVVLSAWFSRAFSEVPKRILKVKPGFVCSMQAQKPRGLRRGGVWEEVGCTSESNTSMSEEVGFSWEDLWTF